MSLFQQTIEEVLWYLTKKHRTGLNNLPEMKVLCSKTSDKMHLMHMTSVLMMLFILDAHYRSAYSNTAQLFN